MWQASQISCQARDLRVPCLLLSPGYPRPKRPVVPHPGLHITRGPSVPPLLRQIASFSSAAPEHHQASHAHSFCCPQQDNTLRSTLRSTLPITLPTTPQLFLSALHPDGFYTYSTKSSGLQLGEPLGERALVLRPVFRQLQMSTKTNKPRWSQHTSSSRFLNRLLKVDVEYSRIAVQPLAGTILHVS